MKYFEPTLETCHPSFLNTALNLSVAYSDQGDDAEAEFMAARAYRGSESLLEPEHVDTKRTVEQLGKVRAQKTGRLHPFLSVQLFFPIEVEELRNKYVPESVSAPKSK